MNNSLDNRSPQPEAMAPVPAVLKQTTYESPSLTPIGNLRDLLGKSGGARDFTYTRSNSGRP